MSTEILVFCNVLNWLLFATRKVILFAEVCINSGSFESGDNLGIKISVLVENTVGVSTGLVAEWGLAAVIDFDDARILFDAGEQGNLLNNAKQLDIDLRTVSEVVLSHGHYDHTGGLLDFLKLRGPLPVHAHPALFSPHHERKKEAGGDRYIGVPFPLEQLERAGAHFIWQREAAEILPNFWLSGEIPRHTDFEDGDSRLIQKVGTDVVKDPFTDDLSIFYATVQGLVIILGCAHAGLVNIVEHARQVTGERRVRAIVGGTHLGPATKEQQELSIAYLHTLELECLAPNHCTGQPIAARLAGEFPEVFRWAPTGTILEF